jgi:hypothetical protein
MQRSIDGARETILALSTRPADLTFVSAIVLSRAMALREENRRSCNHKR